VLNRTGVTGNAGNKESKIIFGFSVAAAAITLWLWPASRSAAKHSMEGMKLLSSLWPVAGGCLLFIVWHRINFSQKVLPDREEKQIGLDDFLLTVMKLLQEKERQNPQKDKPVPYLNRMITQLRKLEKIMGRWKVAGLSYLVLCLCLLFLLL
jgi:hypothetical protein